MPSLRSSGAYRSFRRTLRRAAHPRELAFQRRVRSGFESRFLGDPRALAAYEEEIRESGLLEHVRRKRKEYDAIAGGAGGDYTPGGIGLAERTYLYAILRTLKPKVAVETGVSRIRATVHTGDTPAVRIMSALADRLHREYDGGMLTLIATVVPPAHRQRSPSSSRLPHSAFVIEFPT